MVITNEARVGAYDRLGDSENNQMPSIPPSYEELDVGNAMEQFEIDDVDVDIQPKGLFVKASMLSKKLTLGLSNSVHSVTKLIDPMFEGMEYLYQRYDKMILRVGNPLVVKRILYVLVMVGIVSMISHYTVNESINGSSGGAFSNGRFYNIDKLSAIIQSHIDPKLMQNHLEYFSSMPHITGTVGDLTISRYIETYMKNNGIQNVKRVKLNSFVNYPTTKSYVEINDGSFKAKLYETDNNEMEYLAYNPNGLKSDKSLQAPLVYVNYGSRKDFQILEDNNINLKNCILLIRYGGDILESNKVFWAQEKGASAIIFMSPEIKLGSDDNKHTADDVIQRENVGNGRISTGDILTPGWASENGYSSRLLWFKSTVTPKIPTIPITYEDGMELLKVVENLGYKYEDGYFSGPSNNDTKQVKLNVELSRKDTHEVWNIVGTIEGREQNDKCVIIGSTRDASCFGTISSNTGTVVMLEMIKIFTSIQRIFNWIPSRTIKFVSFDATMYNLAGLTEWIEGKKQELQSQAYTYIDLSNAIAGDLLLIKANPFLHKIIRECLRKVKTNGLSFGPGDDNANLMGETLYEIYKAQNEGLDHIFNQMTENKNYIPFINLLNIPSMEIKFTGSSYPENSCLDDFQNFERSRIDPLMAKHSLLVHVLSNVVLDVADQPFIPFNFGEFVQKLVDYQRDLSKYIDEAIKAHSDPNIPPIQYNKLMRAISMTEESAKIFDNFVDSWKKFIVESADIEQSILAMKRWKWNDVLVLFNQRFLLDPSFHKTSRPGYLNTLFGTAFNDPVNNKDWEWNTFPLIRDCVDEGDFGKAQQLIDELASVLADASRRFIA